MPATISEVAILRRTFFISFPSLLIDLSKVQMGNCRGVRLLPPAICLLWNAKIGILPFSAKPLLPARLGFLLWRFSGGRGRKNVRFLTLSRCHAPASLRCPIDPRSGQSSLQPAPPLPLGADRITHISDCRDNLGWGGVREIFGDDLVEQAVNALHIVRESGGEPLQRRLATNITVEPTKLIRPRPRPGSHSADERQ